MVEVLNGRYELGAPVGAGGMGVVHRALDRRLGRAVAVKVLRGGALADEVARARLRAEATLAASVHHPGVAQVFDYEEDPAEREGLAFIVMELVEGHTLSQLLREQGPLPVDQVMSIVQQVAEGLQAAHDVGVVHRDLKPANIMLTPQGRTVLVDFGIARSAGSEPLTDTGALIGTAEYMSPEQASGRPATPASDLYALGVVAHHCLTGTSPFRRETHVATAVAHLHDAMPPLPDVPEDVRRLVASLIAKDPADRPADAAAVAREAARIGAPAAVDLPETFGEPEPIGAVLDTLVTSATRRPARRRRTMAFAGVGALLVGLGAGYRMMPDDDTSPVPGVVGMDRTDAMRSIRGAGLVPRPTVVDRAGRHAGEVVRQSPARGHESREGTTVTIVVASGKVAVASDDVVGRTYAKASAMLEKLGLEVERRDVVQADHAGEVVALSRSGRLPDGATVVLSVATAPAISSQPTTTGRTSTAAKKASPKPAKAKGHGKGKGKGRKK